MENVIDIRNLYKSFNNIKAVENLSFKVKKGELFAFLGVNGAGKSTTISIICGELEKDSGDVIVNGFNLEKDIAKIKRNLGVVFQTSVLDQSLTVYDNLECRASLYNIFGKDLEKRIDELAEILDFKDLLKRTVGKLSGGQRRRIDIARALIHKPKILILDEPTTGLDPQTRKLVWEVVEKLRKEEDMTVLLTTHYMEEAVDADYVVVIDSGKIAGEGTPLFLKNKYTNDYIFIYKTEEEKVKKLGLDYEKINDGYKVFIENTKEATELIINNPNLFIDYEIIKGKMDDVFLNITGKKLEGGSEK